MFILLNNKDECMFYQAFTYLKHVIVFFRLVKVSTQNRISLKVFASFVTFTVLSFYRLKLKHLMHFSKSITVFPPIFCYCLPHNLVITNI